MICVSFGNIEFEDLKSTLKSYQFAEIRLDLMNLKITEIAEIFSTHKNLIATLRYGENDKVKEFEKVETAISSGAAFLDIDMMEEEEIIHKSISLCKSNNCKIILSYHNHTKTPSLEELKSKVELGFKLKADIVKIVCTANSYTELARILKLYEDDRPIIAFSMGEKGQFSRLLSIPLGSPFTYAHPEDHLPTATFQMSYSKTLEGIKLLSLNSNKYFAVCGKPISHSLSPVLFKAHSISDNSTYCRALCLDYKDIEILLNNGFDGCNVTTPYKEDILKLNFKTSENVEKLGAGNTIYKSEHGFTIENTDIYGVRDSILSAHKFNNSKTVIVLGAGGAAKAAVLAMKNCDLEVVIANRTIKKAKELAEKFDCKYISLEEVVNYLESCEILINTLPSTADFSFAEHFHQGLTILDADYKTKKLKEISNIKQCKYISGEQWLVNQAIPAFKLFTNKEVNKTKLIESLNTKQKNKKSCIVLVGMMKSGKTTIGKLLAEKLGYEFIDTDNEIEKLEKLRIYEIFENKGEKYFRELESKILSKFIKKSKIVISTGGGILNELKNREQIKELAIGIWLFADPKELAKRTENIENRPKLKYGDHEIIFQKLLKKRFNHYSITSEFLIVTDNHKPSKIMEAIYEEIN